MIDSKHVLKNRIIGTCALLFLLLAAAFFTTDFNFAPPPSYTHIYERGILERLDVEGHAIEKHVGKSDVYLFERLQTEDIPAASTFNDMVEADYLVRMVLSERKKLVNKWLESRRSNKKAFYYKSDTQAGRVLKRGWNEPQPGNQVRVVLIRDNKYKEGFYILTAYPEIKN
jgi:hypothetical protein